MKLILLCFHQNSDKPKNIETEKQVLEYEEYILSHKRVDKTKIFKQIKEECF